MTTTSELIKLFSLQKAIHEKVYVSKGNQQTISMTVHELIEQDIKPVYAATTTRLEGNREIKCLQWKGIVIVNSKIKVPYDIYCDIDESAQFSGLCHTFKIFIHDSIPIHVNALVNFLPFKTEYAKIGDTSVLSGTFNDHYKDLCLNSYALKYMPSSKTFKSKDYFSNELFDVLLMFAKKD
jgi:hypothetical protein